MADSELIMALSKNERTAPLIQGRYLPTSPKIRAISMHPAEMFYRQLKFAEFDFSEMSLSSLMISRSKGDDRFLALPIFTMRMFFHTTILVRKDSGIECPADLKGKRIGVPEYQQTWAVWSRGVLQEEFGVFPHEIEWFMERTPDKSHGSSTGFKAPPGVRINQIPETSSIGDMLARGNLDATLIYFGEKNLLDRSSNDLSEVCKPLFQDTIQESARFYRKTGLYPINHAMVIKKNVYEGMPELANIILESFYAAKAEIDACTRNTIADYVACGLMTPDVSLALSHSPRDYGVNSSRDVLETISRYVYEQGLASRKVSIEEIFAPSILGS